MGSHLRVRTWLATFVALGCSNDPRPQLLVVLDTNLPVIDQLAPHPELSSDAAMDSVHVDVLDETGKTLDYVDLAVPDALDWPISFGLIPGTSPTVRVRARLYRSEYAAPSEIDGSLTLTPPALIDRVVDLTFPSSGVQAVEIVLSGDCLGVLPTFGGSVTNCVDAAHKSAPPTEGIVELGASDPLPASQIGTWAPAVEVPCAAPGVDPRTCIPGGFSMLGDTNLSGLLDGVLIAADSSPMRPVIVSPFYLDKNEFTVGELDQLLATQPGTITGDLPQPYDAATSPYCTWLKGASGHESYALNCVERTTAEQICAARGGHLPSEAQWEHAARGRGQHRLYPWGDAPVSCCAASVGGLAHGCSLLGPEPVASHVAPGACNGIVDVSRDGVVDMGGGLMEETRDVLASYTDPCWQSVGPARDPVCLGSGSAYVARGGAWDNPLYYGLLALRFTGLTLSEVGDMGFRCAYDTAGP